MRSTTRWLGLTLTICLATAGCGGSGGEISSTGQTTSTSTVNLVVADTPATDLTVLSFQVQITGAVLQPGNVSLLPRPVTVDLAQLVSDTAFLSSTVIDSATYTSLELTFANPQVTLLNNTGVPIELAGQSCAAGATCTFDPALNNATVTISNGVFPLTVTASSTTGLNLDLSIPDLLQSDLSVTLANGSSVNLALLSGNNVTSIDDVLGTVTAVNGTQISLTTAFGDSLILNESSSTAYAYPSSVCATPTASCVMTGQIVAVDLSLPGDGALGLTSLSYVGSSGSQVVKALILSTDTSATTPSVQALIQREVNVSSLDAGQIATISLLSDAAYSVGVAGYPQITTAGFSTATDLLPGQEVILIVGSDLVTGSAPSFSTGALYLEPSQIIGEVASVDTTQSSIEVTGLSGLFTGARPIIQQMAVQTGSSTNFVGFSSAALTAVNVGQFIAAKGPLFYDTNSATSILSAVQLRARTAGN
jgi:hypothetical protein